MLPNSKKPPSASDPDLKKNIFGSRKLTSILHPASLSFALVGLLITTFAASTLYHSEKEALGIRFEANIAKAEEAITNRLETYTQVLRGAVAFLSSSEEVTRDEWKTYVAHLHLSSAYPGIQGIGFIPILSPGEKSSFEARMREEGFADFRVWPDGDRPVHTAVAFIEPFDERNQRALGYDMMSDPTRAIAMARARDSGLPALSGSVILKQEMENELQPGFLLYLPYYERNTSPSTIEEKRDAISGYVYSAFRMEDFMTGIFGNLSDELGLKIYDTDVPQDRALMYSSEGSQLVPLFKSTTELHMAGHTWQIDIFSLPDFEATLPRLSSLSLALAGVALTLLGMIILADSKSTQENATRIAETMTESLREREAEVTELNASLELEVEQRTSRLEEANAELRSFSYTVSHDLKTPVRHVNTLTEFLIEDHSSELSGNALDYVNRIAKAAGHMGQLIDDILMLATCADARFKPVEIDVTAVAEEITATMKGNHPGRTLDFRITPGMKTTADSTVVRTALQNMIENAVKFSVCRDTSSIEIGEVETDGVSEFFVKDNGIGFDMKYADKVFTLFKRLHPDTDYSGTGVGMATVKKMISRHGGTIRVESEKDSGTTFYFSFGDPESPNPSAHHTQKLSPLPNKDASSSSEVPATCS